MFKSFSDATATATATTDSNTTASAAKKHGSSNRFPETPRETLEDH